MDGPKKIASVATGDITETLYEEGEAGFQFVVSFPSMGQRIETTFTRAQAKIALLHWSAKLQEGKEDLVVLFVNQPAVGKITGDLECLTLKTR